MSVVALVWAFSTLVSSNAALLRQSPFLMTHDSGTGYIGVGDVLKDVAMCQTIGLVDQLNCGARALDMRMFQASYRKLSIGSQRRRTIKYHHGKVPAWKSDQTLDSTLQGLVDWAGSHPSELILLMASHTYHSDSVGALAGDGDMTHDETLMGEVRSFFDKFGVPWEFNCNKANGWSLDEAKAAAKMANGGMMIVLDGSNCYDDMYDSSIDSKSEVKGYVDAHMARGRTLSRMFSIQSLVQQSGIKVPLNADLNHDILDWIGQGVYGGVNLLEVNTVCAYGPDMAVQLGSTVSSADLNTCKIACEYGCKKYGGLPNCGFRSSLELLPANVTLV